MTGVQTCALPICGNGTNGVTAGRILEIPLLAWIGRMSYSLYIWQQLFLPPRATGVWQQAPWNFAAIFACAAISYYCVERPAIAFGRRLARERMSRDSRERQADWACSR